jgi:beta-hydroxylase
MSPFHASRYIVLGLFVASALYVHYRGRVRFKLPRQLFNHSTLLAPYNSLMYLFSGVPARPILDPATLPDLEKLREQWPMMRAEALRLANEGYVRAALHNNDIGFNSFFKRGWKRFYLKWYDQPLPSARALCPQTVALLESLPSIQGAMIASLAPRSRLNPHRDPFAGSLRFHLGLVTANSEDCFISVDGERYAWRDGKGLLFDETYIHFVENNTDVTRLVLLCDVERPIRFRPLATLNHWVNRHIIKASATQNLEAEPVGWLNRFYGKVYHPLAGGIALGMKRVKQANRLAYEIVKYALVLGILALILI